MSASERAPPIARSRKWCTVLCTRRPSATNQKSMMPERGDDLADDPGLLGDLADGGVLGGLALLDVPLGQRPEEAAAAVGAADEGSAGPGDTVVGHHQAPGGGLVDPAQPAAGASAPARPSHARRVARVGDSSGSIAARGRATPDGPRSSRRSGGASAGTTLARRVRHPRVAPIPSRSRRPSRRPCGRSSTSPPCSPSSAARFTAAGFEVHLVGGSVRDALLAAGSGGARVPGRPRRHHRRPPRADARAAARLGGFHVEHRDRLRHRRRRGARRPAGDHHLPGRPLRPGVAQPRGGLGRRRWSTTWLRRDFTVNAMAVSLGPDRTVTDPFGGLGDLLARRLRTPGAAVDSFADDPLRMLRAVRFVAQLRLDAGRRGRRGDDAPCPASWRGSPPSGCRSSCRRRCCRTPRGRRWSCSSTPGWPTSSCPSCRRCGWRSTSTTSTRTSTPTR